MLSKHLAGFSCERDRCSFPWSSPRQAGTAAALQVGQCQTDPGRSPTVKEECSQSVKNSSFFVDRLIMWIDNTDSYFAQFIPNGGRQGGTVLSLILALFSSAKFSPRK